MAITLFRISELPNLVDLLKDGSPAAANTNYPLAEEDELTIDNQSGFKGEFLDSFKIEVSEDGVLWSSETTWPIKELVGVNTPAATDESIAGAKNTSYVPYDLSKIVINASTDRIRITNIEGYGNFTNNGLPLNIGDVVYMHNLPNILAETNNGAGLEYMKLSYYCGNHLGYDETTTYTLVVNVASLAEISSLGASGTNPVIDSLLISNGFTNGVALVSVEATGDLFTEGPASEVTVSFGGTDLVITANGTQNISVPLDNEGNASIEVQHNYSNPGTAATSNVELTILDIDGDPANVSGTDSYTSTINFT